MNCESPAEINSDKLASGSAHPQDPLDQLDHPMWNALHTEHRPFALTASQACRYLPAIGPLAGIADQSPQSYSDLRHLTGSRDAVALFLHEPPAPPSDWTLIRGGLLDQMVFSHEFTPGLTTTASQPPPSDHTIRQLTPADVPAMLELATLTEPGPFQQRTIELGLFYGAFHEGQLIAMAGQRLHLPDHMEVSAVCTHPSARGRGLARLLMSTVMQEILSRGKTPFLHSFSSNAPAIRVYQDLGFTLRRNFHLAVLQNKP